MPTNHSLPSDKERERLEPGSLPGKPTNDPGPKGADIPGGSNEDLIGRRGRTAGEQAGHGDKAAEPGGRRGDARSRSGHSTS